jgi:hypothetical protein
MRLPPLAVALAALFVCPLAAAAAPTPPALLPRAVGERLHVHLVRTVQGATGPLSSASDFDLVRRAPGTLVVERPQPGAPPNVAVVNLRKDGQIAVSDDARGVTGDGDLADILDALNAANAAMHNADSVYHGSWTTPVPLVPAFNGATAMIAFATSNATTTGFDFSGDGSTTGTTAPPTRANPNSAAERAASGFGGRFGGRGGRGGGAPGGGGPGGGPGPSSRSGGTATQIGVHVVGHETAGRVDRLTLTETRSIVVDVTPFVNVSSWAMTFGEDGPTRLQASH